MSRHPSSTAATALVVVAALAAGALGLALSVPRAVGAHGDHSSADPPATDALDPAPPPPEPGDDVGVLGLGGVPMVGPDGAALEVPLDAGAPDELPPPSAEPPTGDDGDVDDPPTTAVADISVLDAHVRTLEQAATALDLAPAATVDLLAANGLLVAVDPAGTGIADVRRLLVLADELADTAQPSACLVLAVVRQAADGVGPDLVGGPGAAGVGRVATARGTELVC